MARDDSRGGRDNGYRGGRGGGGGGRGRGGRGGGGGGGGGYRGGGRGGRGRGGHGRGGGRGNRGRSMAPAESGNQRERISVESGYLVLVDQFMLANPQFIDRVRQTQDADPCERDNLVREFGGHVVELTPGTYRIERDPYKFTIVIHPEGTRPERGDELEQVAVKAGYIFIDTRCLAMIDRELLDDQALLEKYSQLWLDGQEKACRDLLRDNGGAVRYGFGRFGDELGLYTVKDQNMICLWPDVRPEATEEQPSSESEASPELSPEA